MKADHPLTKKQIAALAVLLNKLQAVIESQITNDVLYSNVRVLGSDYTPDVFINFERIVARADGPDPENIYWKISPDGKLDDDALHHMEFREMADRVHFFNSLFEIVVR